MTPTHITQVHVAALELGDLVEQAGHVYEVYDVRRFEHRTRVFFTTEVEGGEGYIYASTVDRLGGLGQIRWHTRKDLFDSELSSNF